MRKSIKKNNQHIFDHRLYGKIYTLFNFKGEAPVDLKKVISFIETNIPYLLFSKVDAIYVSKFSKLKNQGINGLEDQGAIYITDDFSSEADLIKRILHEATHAYVSEPETIKSIDQEFVWKKQTLLKKIQSVFSDKEGWVMEKSYIDFLEENVQAINMLIKDLFVSPYASANKEEYVASGVEVYFLENKQWLKEFCPDLFSLIEDILIKNIELDNNESH